MDKEKDDFNKSNKGNNESDIKKENDILDEKEINEIDENIKSKEKEENNTNNNKEEFEQKEESVQVEKEKQCDVKIKKNKKSVIITCSIIAIVILASVIVNITVNKYENLAYPGMSIYGEDVSKLNKNELIDKVNNIKSNIDKKVININSNKDIYKLQIKDIVLSYNEAKLVDEILNYNKNKNKIEKYISILRKENINNTFKISFNKEILNDEIEKISKETCEKHEEPKVSINGEEIKFIEGKKGTKLDDKLFLASIENGINESNNNKEPIKVSCTYIDDNPKIKIDDLKKVNYKISSYSTTYSPGGGRGRNVDIAAKKIDDLLLMPGDEFSYEKAVGPVTASNGYTYAPIISSGVLVPGIGGGVCQVSSTLYNTQLNAGILPTERRNHSKAVNYVPRGLDATLATGSIDYKFKNTHDYPIVINTTTGGGRLTIEFWSNKDALKGIEYKPVGYASGRTANTYLYGYDKNGNKVYEKHIDTSVYR